MSDNISGFPKLEPKEEINFEEMKASLKPFGNVRECEIKNGEFHIRIVGYQNTMKNMIDLGLIMRPATEQYPFIKKMYIEEGIFWVIAKKAQ